jgi:asparagine N-glycosylation enzyme membrane subunit Stt3
VLALVGAVYAIVHAVRQRPDAFTAVNKLTKPIWLGILIVAALILLATSPVGLLGIIAVVAVCVYLVDVRPRVDDIQHGGSRW